MPKKATPAAKPPKAPLPYDAEWEEQCQRVLKANAGMDLREFVDLLTSKASALSLSVRGSAVNAGARDARFWRGTEALKLLECNSYDVVLCDIMMPDGNGMELYQWVSEQMPGTEART